MKKMSKCIMGVVIGMFLSVLFLTNAGAVPNLQLDISGGSYSTDGTEDIVTDAETFTVYAYATPGGGLTGSEILSDTYFLSIALTPQVLAPVDLGSITLDGTTIAITDDMTFGTPPLDVVLASADLPGHGIFETYYFEQSFTFNGTDKSGEYNVEDDAGQGPITGSDMFYVAFEVDKSLLNTDNQLHFDLYDTKMRSGNVVLGLKAPFSHDASTIPGGGGPGPTPTPTPNVVPEPTTVLLLGIGLAGMAGAEIRRRRKKGKEQKS